MPYVSADKTIVGPRSIVNIVTQFNNKSVNVAEKLDFYRRNFSNLREICDRRSRC